MGKGFAPPALASNLYSDCVVLRRLTRRTSDSRRVGLRYRCALGVLGQIPGLFRAAEFSFRDLRDMAHAHGMAGLASPLRDPNRARIPRRPSGRTTSWTGILFRAHRSGRNNSASAVKPAGVSGSEIVSAPILFVCDALLRLLQSSVPRRTTRQRLRLSQWRLPRICPGETRTDPGGRNLRNPIPRSHSGSRAVGSSLLALRRRSASRLRLVWRGLLVVNRDAEYEPQDIIEGNVLRGQIERLFRRCLHVLEHNMSGAPLRMPLGRP
jgi:hypothetical protein